MYKPAFGQIILHDEIYKCWANEKGTYALIALWEVTCVHSRDDISYEQPYSFASTSAKIVSIYGNLWWYKVYNGTALIEAHLNVSLPVDITEDLLQ